MNPKRKKNIYRVVAAGLAALTLVSAAVPAFADFRDAGTWNVDKGKAYSWKNGKTYYQHTESGMGVYVPFDVRSDHGTVIIDKMFTGLFDIYRTGEGKHYESAGFKYNTNKTAGGKPGKYFIKTVAFEPFERTYESIPASVDIDAGYNVEFRYAGVMVDPKRSTGSVVNNPGFPSDTIEESGNYAVYRYPTYSNQGAIQALKANVEKRGTDDYVEYEWMKDLGTWKGNSGIPSNEPSVYNQDETIVEATFEEWARTTAIGAKYKEEFLHTDQKWWNVANKKFRIDGDITQGQSVVLSIVYELGGTWYRTYQIPQPFKKNVAPEKIQILSQNDTVVDYSEKDWHEPSALDGVVQGSANVKNGGSAVTLTKGDVYKINVGLAYFSKELEETTSSRSGGIIVKICDRNNPSKVYKEYYAQNTLSLVNPSSEEQVALDLKSSTLGINTPAMVTSSDRTETYYYTGIAPYLVPEFIVDDSVPVSGSIYAYAADQFSLNGDNEVVTDDMIKIDYTVTEGGGGGVDPQDPAPGDMNIGQREYRALHHRVTEDVPTGEVDEAGNEITEEVDFEYVTDFGTYDTPGAAGEGEAVGEWEGFPGNDNGRNYYIDEDSWWEYDQEWPDQIADLEWKCWIEKNGEYDPSGTFTRSELNNNPFDLGFTISRNRGEETVNNPTLKLNIYGVSPDTGEDGELIAQYTNQSVVGNSIPSYTETSAYYKDVLVDGACDEYYPFIRVEAQIDTDIHGESGIYGATAVNPYNNGWQDEHDSVTRTFQAEPDDMRIMEVEIKDSEGIVIYHADRYDSDQMDVTVHGYFDKEEDCTMKVVIEQNIAADHVVKDPAIDVQIDGCNQSGYSISTYVDTTLTNYGELGEGVQTTYANIAFRPKDVSKINFDIAINDKHGDDGWRENIWNEEDDHYNDTLDCTTADLAVSQDIELYNSKNNRQDYLTFAEYVSFKFNIKHIGNNERARRVVGGSTINPYAKLNIKIYNADKLTRDSMTNQLKYSNVYIEDPKADEALVRTMDISAKSRLFPGLGSNGYSSHVQAWVEDYIVESWKTETGNIAAYGDILVTGNIDQQHDYNETNIRNNATDYVQKEFKGEKDFEIVDMAVTARNSVSEDTGLAVQVAIKNLASSYNDQTVTDKTYLDVYVDDELMKTVTVELPVGDTTVTEVVIPKVELDKCLPVEVRVNTGKHQTHYEYVLATTNSTANADPFFNNYKMMTVCPNLPNQNECPDCLLEGGQEIEVQDIFREANP